MKNTTTSINKKIKNFDKELRNLLLTDLKVARKALIKSISKPDSEHLMIA